MEVWELTARESIRDLVARYNASGDSGRFDETMALFADDAVVEVVPGRTYTGCDEIRSLFTGAAKTNATPKPDGRAEESALHPTSRPTKSPFFMFTNRCRPASTVEISFVISAPMPR